MISNSVAGEKAGMQGQKIRKSTLERGRQGGREERGKSYTLWADFFYRQRGRQVHGREVLFCCCRLWTGFFLPNIASSTIEINRVTHCYSIFWKGGISCRTFKNSNLFFPPPLFAVANGSCLGAAPMETEMIFQKLSSHLFFSIQLCARRMLQTCKKCHVRAKDDMGISKQILTVAGGGRKHGFHLSAGTHVISADATSTVYLLGTPLLQIRKTT